MSEDQLTKILDQQFTKFFGQLTRYTDEKLEVELTPVRQNVEHIRNTVDGIAGSLDSIEVEQAAVSSGQDRHQDWIKQLAENTHTKLIPEL